MAPRNSKNNALGSTASNPVLVELTRQSLERMQTQITAQTQILADRAKDQIKILGDIASTLADLKNDGGSSIFGGGGGSWGGGPNARPRMNQNQTRRPTMGPQGYPGPGSPGFGPGGDQHYGFGGYGGGAMGAMGGLLGWGQAMAARALHERSGLGDAHWQPVMDEHRNVTSFRRNTGERDAQGNPVFAHLSPEEFQRRAAVSERAARLGGSGSIMGGIKGLIGEVPMAGKVVGAGLAVAESGYKLGQFVGNQRAANAQYQAIYGPGTSGWDQRVNNAGYRFRNTMRNLGSAFGIGDGGLSDSDADKAFKGVSAMGYQGATRNNALGFTRGNFNSMGMSVDQSLALIGINAREAGTGLQELHTRLKQVSDMARQTGQSAEVFRQSFIQNYGQAVNAGFAGSSSIAAQAQVSATVGQGRLFAGLNTGAMYGSVGAQQVLANRMGMTSVLDFTIATENNPQVLASAQDKQLNQLFMAAVPADVREMVQQSIAKHGGNQNVATNQNAAQSVVRDVEQQHGGALNAIAIQQAMVTAGIAGAESLDPMAASIYYVQWVAKGGHTFGGPTARAVAGRQQKTGAAAARALPNALLSNQKVGIGIQGGKTVFDPVIARMGSEHVKSVQVQTASGTQLVSLQTAATQFRDQLANGTAIIGSGPNAGQSVATIYGSEQNQHYGDSTGKKIKTDFLHPGGGSQLSAKQIQKYHDMGLSDEQIGTIGGVNDKGLRALIAHAASAQNSGGGKVMVDLSADAKKYLNITTSGDNLVNQAAASGGVPSIPGATGSPTGH